MAFEIRPNSGSLWKNDKKEKDNPEHEKFPDSTGQGVIECPHCGKSWGAWLNGWRKVSKKDNTQYLSLSFKPKDQNQGQQRGGSQGQSRGGQQGGGNQYAEARSGGGGQNVSGNFRNKPFVDDDVPF